MTKGHKETFGKDGCECRYMSRPSKCTLKHVPMTTHPLSYSSVKLFLKNKYNCKTVQQRGNSGRAQGKDWEGSQGRLPGKGDD